MVRTTAPTATATRTQRSVERTGALTWRSCPLGRPAVRIDGFTVSAALVDEIALITWRRYRHDPSLLARAM